MQEFHRICIIAGRGFESLSACLKSGSGWTFRRSSTFFNTYRSLHGKVKPTISKANINTTVKMASLISSIFTWPASHILTFPVVYLILFTDQQISFTIPLPTGVPPFDLDISFAARLLQHTVAIAYILSGTAGMLKWLGVPLSAVLNFRW